MGGKITPRPRTLHHAPSWFWVAEALGIEEEVQKVNPFSQSTEILMRSFLINKNLSLYY
jgi:hypothetical protein